MTTLGISQYGSADYAAQGKDNIAVTQLVLLSVVCASILCCTWRLDERIQISRKKFHV